MGNGDVERSPYTKDEMVELEKLIRLNSNSPVLASDELAYIFKMIKEALFNNQKKEETCCCDP